MYDLVQEIRFAFRQLARRPGINGLAVLSLALGIGVNTTIFTLVNAVLLRGLPANRPGELVSVFMSEDDKFRYATASYPDYVDLRDRNTVFSELTAYDVAVASYDNGEATEVLFGQAVTGNYFRMLGLPLAAGRDFSAEDREPPGSQPVVMLGHRFWRSRFHADPGVAGRTLQLNGKALTVVGVAPAELSGSMPGIVADFWIPMAMHDAMSEGQSLTDRGSRSLWLNGRLKPGVTLEQAQSQMSTLVAQLAAAYPDDDKDLQTTLVPTGDVALNPAIDKPVFGVATLLLVVAALVLLIACSNIANLLLARASDRAKEIAIRLAIGSGRWPLVRQLLAESLLLAVAGGALGLLFALWAAQLLVSFKPPLPIPINLDLSPDLRVFAYALGLALLTGIACGLAPALRASRPRLVSALKSEGASLPGAGRGRRLSLRNALVVWQVALSTVLLIGAGLFLRSLSRAQAIDPGFTLRKGVVVTVALGLGSGYTPEEGLVFYREASERLAALPGVSDVALTEHLPLAGNVHITGIELESRPVASEDDELPVDTASVSPGYFQTLGVALVAGRDFSLADGPGAGGMVIVNQAAAESFWPGEEAVGKRLRLGRDDPWQTVVGVVANGKYRTLGEAPRPFLYGNLQQDYSSVVQILVATEGDEQGLLPAVRQDLLRLDPALPLLEVKTMTEHLAFMLFPARMAAVLLASFGLLGLVLASVGLYGVVAYAVARRTREVGIRMAIGAGARDVLRLVVGEGMALVAVGLGLGVTLALAGTQALESLLYGVSSVDPWTFVAVPVLLSAVALAANLLPARRATAIAPVVALRQE